MVIIPFLRYLNRFSYIRLHHLLSSLNLMVEGYLLRMSYPQCKNVPLHHHFDVLAPLHPRLDFLQSNHHFHQYGVRFRHHHLEESNHQYDDRFRHHHPEESNHPRFGLVC
jgi:hypothetical protein